MFDIQTIFISVILIIICLKNNKILNVNNVFNVIKICGSQVKRKKNIKSNKITFIFLYLYIFCMWMCIYLLYLI